MKNYESETVRGVVGAGGPADGRDPCGEILRAAEEAILAAAAIAELKADIPGCDVPVEESPGTDGEEDETGSCRGAGRCVGLLELCGELIDTLGSPGTGPGPGEKAASAALILGAAGALYSAVYRYTAAMEDPGERRRRNAGPLGIYTPLVKRGKRIYERFLEEEIYAEALR